MHDQTKAALIRAEQFVSTYGDGLPDMNIEIARGQVEIHLHLVNPTELTWVHDTLGQPTWKVSEITDTSATTTLHNAVQVSIYYSHIRDEPDAQGPLRALGLVKGLVAL